MSDIDWESARQELETAVRLLMIPHAPEDRALAAAKDKFEHAFPEDAEIGDPRAEQWAADVRRIWERSDGAAPSEEGQYEFSRLLWELYLRADRKVRRQKEG